MDSTATVSWPSGACAGFSRFCYVGIFGDLSDPVGVSWATFWHLLAHLLSGKKHAKMAVGGDFETQIARNSKNGAGRGGTLDTMHEMHRPEQCICGSHCPMQILIGADGSAHYYSSGRSNTRCHCRNSDSEYNCAKHNWKHPFHTRAIRKEHCQNSDSDTLCCFYANCL